MDELNFNSTRLLSILGNWADGQGGLYLRLAASLQRGIERGDLPAGSRLPAEREMARALAVSRTTVVASYDLLAADGLVERRQGSGTYIRGLQLSPPPVNRQDLGAVLDGNTMFRGLIAGPSEAIDFSLAAPLPAPAVRDALQRLTEVMPDVNSMGRGYLPAGLPALRMAIAAYLTDLGVPTNERQVLVTTGGQQAINLAASLWITPGDVVLVEDPTYHGALDAFRSARARLLPVPVDGHGVRVDLIRELVGRTSPRLIYLTPSFNNPTGAVLSHSRRQELTEVARSFRVPVVEDLVLIEVPLTAQPLPPPVAALDHEGWVMTVGSMSKLFWGGLRVGWIRASEQIIFRLAQLKAVTDLGSSLIPQIASVDLLRRTGEVRAWRAADSQQHMQRLAAGLRAHLPSWTWDAPLGGNDLWVRLPQGNATDFLQVAARFGVTAAAGPLFSADGSFADRLRLTFLMDDRDMEEGIRRLAAAWDAYVPRSVMAKQEVAPIV